MINDDINDRILNTLAEADEMLINLIDVCDGCLGDECRYLAKMLTEFNDEVYDITFHLK